jgi:hypothetical protein
MKKNLVGLLELEMAVLECFLKKAPLNPLGVNEDIKFPSFKGKKREKVSI